MQNDVMVDTSIAPSAVRHGMAFNIGDMKEVWLY